MSSLRLSIIVAMTADNGIGFKNSLPWSLPNELRNFAKLTKNCKDKSKQNAVVMGRNTWESIPAQHRPLKDRLNVVLSSTLKDAGEGVLVCPRLKDALTLLEENYQNKIENVWIIGGARVYEDALNLSNCHKLHVTHIQEKPECDVFFPTIPRDFQIITTSEMVEENGFHYNYQVYERRTSPDGEANGIEDSTKS
ncbi:unnamed protein product [Bemisia tabaci]|uniref:dihydrofolate reductase n=1 Tax=Bemisia tabaci TaxID=7038 RepID=A0AAI8UU27_BEMTA|nr:PREDICTED: dihydrofolate reductase [Bemisia tabaci]CAH0746878.1 unnamed protein product [Bemisia tabaci]